MAHKSAHNVLKTKEHNFFKTKEKNFSEVSATIYPPRSREEHSREICSLCKNSEWAGLGLGLQQLLRNVSI